MQLFALTQGIEPNGCASLHGSWTAAEALRTSGASGSTIMPACAQSTCFAVGDDWGGRKCHRYRQVGMTCFTGVDCCCRVGMHAGTCSGLVIPSPAIREVTQACVQDSWSCGAWKRLGRKVFAILLVVCGEASRNMKDGLSPHTYGRTHGGNSVQLPPRFWTRLNCTA